MSEQKLYGKCPRCGLDIDEEREERINDARYPWLKDTNHYLRKKIDKMHATGLCLACYELEY
jgi:hypothetical protein